MRKNQILTYAALLILPFAIYQSNIEYNLVAQASSVLAFVFAFIDNNKITGKLQMIVLFLTAISLAYIVEQVIRGFPFSGLAILLSVSGLSARMVLIKVFSYSRFRYFELMIAILSVSSFSIGFISQLNLWYYFFPVFIIFIFQLNHAIGIIKNAKMLDKGIEKGYNANIGTKAPDFFLPDQHGNGVSLSEYKNSRNVLLIFVRGDWCPYCHMIMRTYMREIQKFKEKNIMLIAVGPDPVGINREMALRLGLDYKVLYDDKMKIAQEYGIRLPDYSLPGATFHEEGMPLPASFLIDKKGMVVYTSRTTKVGEFLDPSLIFPIVESLN